MSVSIWNSTQDDGRTGVIWNGEGDPNVVFSFGDPGDFYIDLDTWNIYGPKTLTGWGVGVPLIGGGGTQGPKGDTGPAGPIGPRGPKGDKGDAGQRGATGSPGAQGLAGTSTLTGSGAPDSTLGNIGDLYLDSDNGDLWGPKDEFTDWGTEPTGNLRGATGPKGDPGEVQEAPLDGQRYLRQNGGWTVTGGGGGGSSDWGDIAGDIDNQLDLIERLEEKVDAEEGKGLSTEDYTSGEKEKLSGIEEEATKNSSDSYLLDRANHTGMQNISTVDGLTDDLMSLSEGIGTLEIRVDSLIDDLGTAAYREALGTSGELYSRDSIIGTVSQSAGVPTGAIIERGSNANGGYVRWADGTQLAFGRKTFSALPIATAFGTQFRNLAVDGAINLPVSFLDTDDYCATVTIGGRLFESTTVQGVQQVQRSNALELRAIFTAPASGSYNLSASYIVIGRWDEGLV